MKWETLEREKNVVLYGQSLRFRLVKYSIIIPLIIGLYLWKGWDVTIQVLAIALVASVAIHVLFRWKTKGWRRSWWLYTPPSDGEK